MIKDLKFAFQCMKYAYNKKMLIGMTFMFLLMGGLQFSIGRPINYLIGGIMLSLAPNMYCQMFQTVNMSNLVLSSPYKKRMGVRILTLLNSLSTLTGFLLFSIAIMIVYQLGECPGDIIGSLYVVQGILSIVIMIYTAISYKHYIISSVVFMFAFIAVFAVAVILNDSDFTKVSVPVPIGLSVALICIIIAGFAFCGVTKLVYKSPVDKHAMQSYLRGEV